MFLEYNLQIRERLRVNSRQIPIKNSQTYIINFEVIGQDVPDYCSYFVIHFLDKNNVEVTKKIRWLTKLSDEPKKFELIFRPSSETSFLVFGFRINDENTFTSNQKIFLKFTNPNNISLKEIPDSLENSDQFLYHPQWQTNRINYIIKNYEDYFKNSKTVVNMGAFYGDLSFLTKREFENLQFINEEGREENIKIGLKKYPEFHWSKINFEECNLKNLPKADIVFNMGLLYHISHQKAKDILLASIERANKIIFFETEVIDCDNEDCFVETSGRKHMIDQSLNDFEIKPSITYINNILKETGYDYDFIESFELNGDGHLYDWKVQNTKNWKSKRRKFWVIKKEKLPLTKVQQQEKIFNENEEKSIINNKNPETIVLQNQIIKLACEIGYRTFDLKQMELENKNNINKIEILKKEIEQLEKQKEQKISLLNKNP